MARTPISPVNVPPVMYQATDSTNIYEFPTFIEAYAAAHRNKAIWKIQWYDSTLQCWRVKTHGCKWHAAIERKLETLSTAYLTESNPEAIYWIHIAKTPPRPGLSGELLRQLDAISEIMPSAEFAIQFPD
jgi:hypothetical protein